MEEGATPSNAYDLLKEASEFPISGLRVEKYQVISTREANLDYLSDSDIECLDQIIDIYGKMPNWYRRRDAHDAAWEKAWNNRGDKRSASIPIESIAELLSEPEDIINYLSNSDT